MTQDAQLSPGSDQPAAPTAVNTMASFWARLGASFIDELIVLVPLVLVQLIPWAPLGSDLGQTAVQLAIPIVYGGALVTWSGRTIGMRALNIRVVPLAPDSELSAGQAWVRAVAFNLPTAVPVVGVGPLLGLIDCCWMLWDKPNRQTLHDKIARTIVVSTLPALEQYSSGVPQPQRPGPYTGDPLHPA